MHRRFFIRAGSVAAAAGLVGVAAGRALPAASPVQPVRYVSNPALVTILPANRWPGTPVDARGRFMNHEFPFLQPVSALPKWLLQRNPQRAEKKADPFRLAVHQTDAFLRGTDDVIVWLGHASFFMRLGSISLLIDPVLGDLPVGGRRLSALPFDPAALTGLDYVLVSHAHYDHCDKASLRQLRAQNPQAQFLTGLGLDKLLTDWLPGARVQAAGWYQQYDTGAGLRVTFLPARHWSNRGPGDTNETLWGAFMLQVGGRQVYFSGDSGYGSHFKEVGQLFPGLDVALMGAGAYSPRWFMAPNHQDPAHAIRAFHDTGARLFVPMHYGTFDLSDEPLGEPARLLTSYRDAGQLNDNLRLLAAGESLGFPA